MAQFIYFNQKLDLNNPRSRPLLQRDQMINQLEQAAAIGSPTASALLQQITKENAEALNLAQQEILADSVKLAESRAAHIREVQERAAQLLERYDQLRLEIEATVIAVAKLDVFELPFSRLNRVFPTHLRKIHLPPSKLGRLEIESPTFSSMEAKLMQEKL